MKVVKDEDNDIFKMPSGSYMHLTLKCDKEEALSKEQPKINADMFEDLCTFSDVLNSESLRNGTQDRKIEKLEKKVGRLQRYSVVHTLATIGLVWVAYRHEKILDEFRNRMDNVEYALRNGRKKEEL